ncbi:CHASE2 domain-containing protein [Ectothiorhodospiraceae bacterium 2226]|nr:CHASE2 domain-containing protein [Ectothiorhodospiraceae bacterium 2226]
MKTPQAGRRRAVRSERLTLAAIALLFLAGSAWFGWERVVLDGAGWLFPSRAAADAVVVVGVDGPSLDALGPWPWPRQQVAALLDRVHQAEPVAVGLTLPLHGPDPYAEHHLRLQQPDGLFPDHHFADLALAEALQRAAVVLAMAPGEEAAPRVGRLKAAGGLRPLAVDPATIWLDFLSGQPLPPPLTAHPPLAPLARAAAGVGPLGARADADGRVRREVLWWPADEGAAVPSFAVQLAALGAPEGRRANGLEALRAGSVRQVLPGAYRTRAQDEREIAHYGAAAVLAGEVPAERLAGRVVLVGLSAPDLAEEVTLAGRGVVPDVVGQAHAVNALLEGDYLRVPEWSLGARLGALVALGLLMVWIFPLLGSLAAGVLGVLIGLGLLHGQLVLQVQQGLWVPLGWPALAVLVATGALLWQRRLRAARGALVQRLDQTEREFGKVLQGQGRLEEAFERYKHCVPDADLLERLYTLGQEYERRRAYVHAVEVFRFIAAHDPAYGDVDQLIRRNRRKAKVIAQRAETGGGGTVGPYRIEREIGRGAMGAVYLAYNRRTRAQVALKTLVLTGESEASALDEVRARFFREAEAAGRLDHPNIIAVHDVGEERQIAYIAMDYLDGSNLLRYTEQAQLLPAGTVFELMIQVADALGYAHDQGVVHRDIKPANILYDVKTGTAKVADFGVASLTGSGNTRTGTILGSPSYMSPEQLTGARVDGRSDLFSLGVTFYQLLTGELPFAGDSLPNIMYRITHDKHPDVRERRPELPSCVTKLLNKMLHKDPERRYPDGHYLAQMLRKCRAHLPEEDEACTQKACG